MHRVQKAIRPQLGIYTLPITLSFRHQHAEGRQVLILAAQTVAEPGPHTRPVSLLGARLEERDCRVMIDSVGVQGADDAQIIHHLSHMWEQTTHPRTAFSMPGKVNIRAHHRKGWLPRGHPGKPLTATESGRDLLAHHGAQFRPIVKTLKLRYATALKQL